MLYSSPLKEAMLFDAVEVGNRFFDDLVAVLKRKDVVLKAEKHAGIDAICVINSGMRGWVLHVNPTTAESEAQNLA